MTDSIPEVKAALPIGPLLIKKPTAYINSDDPWADDVLNRGGVAKRLTNLVSTITQPFVISLHAPYGAGKSFFIGRWAQSLKKDGFTVVQFDAWTTDFSDDPLIAFVSAIRTQLQLPGDNTRLVSEKARSFGKRLAGAIRQKGFPILVQAIAEKALGKIGAEEFRAALDDTALFEKVLEESIDGHKAAENSISLFQKELSNLVEAIGGGESDRIGKLVILVDELDRCRPTYAVEVLEAIKHFFSVDGVIFVLALDHVQLEHAVKAVYGEQTDSEGYLSRFVDIRLRLPDPDRRQFTRALWSSYRFTEMQDLQQEMTEDSFAMFSTLYKLQLRDQVRQFTKLNLIVRTMKFRQFTCCLVAVMFWRVHDSEFLAGILADPRTAQANLRRFKKRPPIPGGQEGLAWSNIMDWVCAAVQDRTTLTAMQQANQTDTRNIEAMCAKIREAYPTLGSESLLSCFLRAVDHAESLLEQT